MPRNAVFSFSTRKYNHCCAPATLETYLKAYLDAEGQYYDFASNFSSNAPGEQSQYSNIGAALAGFTLEVSTGQSLADYAMQEIFSPLGMHNTSWKRQDMNDSNIATPHMVLDGESLQAIPVYELATWPDGGLRSSAADLAVFVATTMNGGARPMTDTEAPSINARILTDESVERMLTPLVDRTAVFWEHVTHEDGEPEWQLVLELINALLVGAESMHNEGGLQ